MHTPTKEYSVSPPSDRDDGVMEIACRLAGHGAVGAMHIVLPDRPTYDDLLHYRCLADANNLSLTVTADTIVLRPITAAATPRSDDSVNIGNELVSIWHRSADTWRSASRRVAAHLGTLTAIHWLHTHLVTWDAGFTGLNEGTR